MSRDFTSTSSTKPIDRAHALVTLRQCADVASALRMLLELQAIAQRRNKSEILAGMVSSKTWYDHVRHAGSISPESFKTYLRELATSHEERDILNNLYVRHVADQALIGRVGRAVNVRQALNNLCAEAGLSAEAISEIRLYKRFLSVVLDSRVKPHARHEIKGRADTIRNAVVRKIIKLRNDVERQWFLALLALTLHINAYTRDDPELQRESIQLIEALDHLHGELSYEYIRRVIRLYGLNRQDKSFYSSDAAGDSLQRMILEEFKKLQTATSEASEDRNQLIPIGSAIDYNVASLLGEMDRENRRDHALRIADMNNRDADNGLPELSLLYNTLSIIELMIRDGQNEEADYLSNHAIAKITLLKKPDLLIEAQLRFKKVKSMVGRLRELSPSDAVDLAAQIIRECNISIAICDSNENARMGVEIASVRDLVALSHGLTG